MKKTTSVRRKRRPRLMLRARSLMTEREIKSVAELCRRLGDIGIVVSNPQLSRIVDNQAELLNVKLLSGLIAVFECEPGDLFTVKR